MKKIAFAPFVVAASLAVSACGDKTTENTIVTNDIVLNEDDPVYVGNLTAVDTQNGSDLLVDDTADAALNATDASGNAVANTL